jgi:shikimate kinase
MYITLIGMSNIGKSYWSERLLKEAGFERVCCDYLIEQELSSELKRLGFSGLEEVSDWMGKPGDERYIENSQKYLKCEEDVMENVLKELAVRNSKSSVVVDTSGSVIYMSDRILEKLRAMTKVVYFEANKEHYQILFEQYKFSPKPLIWNGKTDYFELLESRAVEYEKLSHFRIPFEVHRGQAVNGNALLNYLNHFVK